MRNEEAVVGGGGRGLPGHARRLLRWGLALTLAAVATGCNRDEVTHFRVAKAPPPGGGDGAVAFERMLAEPAMAAPASVDVPPPPAPAADLRWELPPGWTETRGGGAMRYATLVPPGGGKIEVTVIVLPGPAGGELANVNRWRNQIGLAPLDEAALGKARSSLRAKAGPISVYDFTSDGPQRSRVVAGLAERAGSTWFVKMSGEADAVAAARPAFVNLLESLRFDASH